MTIHALAARIRALADAVYAAAGKESDCKDLMALARQRFLVGVSSDLHRLGRAVGTWGERNGP